MQFLLPPQALDEAPAHAQADHLIAPEIKHITICIASPPWGARRVCYSSFRDQCPFVIKINDGAGFQPSSA